jgi:hypothetical protein
MVHPVCSNTAVQELPLGLPSGQLDSIELKAEDEPID